MTTLIIDIKNRNDAKKIANALRLMESVANITITNDSPEPILGLSYNTKERISAVHRAEDDIIAGRVFSAEEIKAKFPIQ